MNRAELVPLLVLVAMVGVPAAQAPTATYMGGAGEVESVRLTSTATFFIPSEATGATITVADDVTDDTKAGWSVLVLQGEYPPDIVEGDRGEFCGSTTIDFSHLSNRFRLEVRVETTDADDAALGLGTPRCSTPAMGTTGTIHVDWT